jgi:3-hydroxyisobutyrate dehydrogenase-like beta-hydroxyacid dehydrogenase
MKIGFIGLGAMGSAMASVLVKAGHEVTVWNRSPQAAQPLAELGARVAATPAEAAAGAEAVLSMLANDQAVREALLAGGVLEAMPKGAVHVNHATISMALVGELVRLHEAHGLGYVAAPVFGRPPVAAEGKLTIAVGGRPAAVAKVQALLDALGAKVWPAGDKPENAAIVKIAGNFMIAAAIESMAEATTLTRAYGVSAADFIGLMGSTLFAAPIYQNYGKLIAEERFSPPGFALALGHKDIGLGLAAGEAARVPMPFAGVLRDNLLEAIAAGAGELDLSALAQVAARRARLDER